VFHVVADKQAVLYHRLTYSHPSQPAQPSPPPPRLTSTPSTFHHAAVDPLVIYRSTDGDGATYSLRRSAQHALRARFGDAVRLPRVAYVEHVEAADRDAVHEAVRAPVVALLTGLPMGRLHELGEVVFRDAATDADLCVWRGGR
jgi:hypothetical protein